MQMEKQSFHFYQRLKDFLGDIISERTPGPYITCDYHSCANEQICKEALKALETKQTTALWIMKNHLQQKLFNVLKTSHLH